MPSLTESRVVIEIKNATYAVEAIDPGFAGVAAARVTKLVNGESYDVVLTHDYQVTCECPDWVCRHEGRGTHCKHGKAMVDGGFLVASVSGGSPVAEASPVVSADVRPVTEMDLKRASFFKLRIPAMSAPVSPIVSARSVPEEVREPIAGPDPRAGTMDVMVDGVVSNVAPSLAADDEAAAGVVDEWSMGESVALLMTMATLEDGDDEAFYRLDDEFRAEFSAYLVAIGSPVSTWPGWLDLCRSGSPVSFPRPACRGLIEAEGPRPAVSFGYTPTRWEDDRAVALFSRPARRPARPRYTGTGITDEDLYPAGACS